MPLLDENGVMNWHGHLTDCWPRLLWQALFDTYREAGGNLDRMDNLLIDLRCCVSACEGIDRGGATTFLWAFSPHGHTSFRPDTEYDAAAQVWFDFRYRITVNSHMFKLERIVDGPVDDAEEVRGSSPAAGE